MSTHVVLIDNHDSFVYNLVDAFAVAGVRCTVFRNTVPPEHVMAANPDVICLSPGPGHPRDAGHMMQLIDAAIGTVPILGICLGFQALLEHFGGVVAPCGPMHGVTDIMTLTDEGAVSPLFAGLTVDVPDGDTQNSGRRVPVARYHSLGCVDVPKEFVSLGNCQSDAGEVTMAALTRDNLALGLQFHPESVLSPSGPHILNRSLELLLSASAKEK